MFIRLVNLMVDGSQNKQQFDNKMKPDKAEKLDCAHDILTGELDSSKIRKFQ